MLKFFYSAPAGNYMFQANNRNTRWRRSGVFIVNFEHISHLFLVFISSTLSKLMSAGAVLTTKQLTF